MLTYNGEMLMLFSSQESQVLRVLRHDSGVTSLLWGFKTLKPMRGYVPGSCYIVGVQFHF